MEEPSEGWVKRIRPSRGKRTPSSYPGGPVDLNVGVVFHLCEVVAGVPLLAIGVVEGSIIAVIGCVVCQDYIFLIFALFALGMGSDKVLRRSNADLGGVVPCCSSHLQLILVIVCVDEVGVDVQPGWADASRAAVGVGQAQVRGAQIARGLCLG